MDNSSQKTLDYIRLLIDDYQIRLAKIEKAAHRIREYDQEKAAKESAATQTRRFIKDLKRLKRKL